MFYVAGGLLAGWAVLLGVLGLSRHDFPSSRGSERLVILVTLVLTVAAVGTGIVSGVLEPGEREAEPEAALVEAR